MKWTDKERDLVQERIVARIVSVEKHTLTREFVSLDDPYFREWRPARRKLLALCYLLDVLTGDQLEAHKHYYAEFLPVI